MQLTVKVKLKPNQEQEIYIDKISKEYIKTVNEIVSVMIEENKSVKLTSKDIKANLPSAVKNQAIRDSKSIFKKSKRKIVKSIPILKKAVCIWNNQNYKIKDNTIQFPVIKDGKSKRISVKTIITDYQKNIIENSKLGTIRITKKSNKWIAQISVEVRNKEKEQGITMGIDLGLKVPAVAVTQNGKTKFFGKGRENKYIKRKFRSKRKQLGKAKKVNAIRKLNNKEQRWMKDKDHKVSREIINFAKQNNVSVIRLEQLTNIRNTARTSRKNEKNLHTWSFYRLAQFIEYKSKLEGIEVEYVNPKNTSKKCPNCGELNYAKDRKYSCKCGYKAHRDRVGAINIINATVVDGKSLSA